jgi:FAD/FMN-containing dehydrogenase
MTRTTSGGIDSLREAMSGPVYGPDDADYDEARRVWNADIDRRPAVIARCTSAEDVVAAVTYAQEAGLEIAVRGGAHSMWGASVGEGGLMVDLSRMNRVVVDPELRLALVGGGALQSDVDVATQAHGLAVPLGAVGHTGVGGITLGGGMGWLSRKAGLTLDNLASAQVVLANGSIVRAAEDENPDLFWAIRGGGGNFGVVTEFEYRLYEVGPMVQFGLFFWPADRGTEVLRLARDVQADLPRSMNLMPVYLSAPPAPFVPTEHHFTPGFALLLVGFGAEGEHAAVVERMRQAGPLFDEVSPMPFVALQQMLDEANAWGFHCYDKGCYLADLTDDAITVLAEQLPRKSSPLSVAFLYRLDGAYSEVGEEDTAFSGGRSPRYMVFIVAVAPEPALLVADRAWVRETWEALRPHSIGIGSYVNAMTEQDDDRIRASYGPAKYDRLAQLKARYDPGNVFRRNANIKPA